MTLYEIGVQLQTEASKRGITITDEELNDAADMIKLEMEDLVIQLVEAHCNVWERMKR